MCNNHDHGRLDPDDFLTFDSLEARELKRRWPIAMRELKALTERIRDIQGANPEPLHPGITDAEKHKLGEALAAALSGDNKPE